MVLSNIIDENINLIYYFITSETKNKILLNNILTIEKIKKKYKFNNRKFVSYWYNNLQYTYELENDNQCLFKYDLCNSLNEKCLILMYNEIKLPIYMFPSIKNLSYKEEYSLEEHKINNRISLFIKKESIYICFRYSKKCDIDNNIQLIESLINELHR